MINPEKIKIGDMLYYATFGNKQVQKICPVCFGKKEVILISGNDVECVLPCNYCGRGYEDSRGYVQEYEYMAEASIVFIRNIEINVYENEKKFRFTTSDNYSVYMEDLFENEEDALKRAEEKKAIWENDQTTRTNNIKENKNKSYSWNAGYHMREVKKAQKNIEYHTKMAKICKERSNDNKETK